MISSIFMRKNSLSANKAQSMTEMAVFGSLLLMVLAWLVQMGMTYTEQQKLNMEAFRTALGVAAQDNQTNHSQLVYVKDIRIPNPQDKLGMGSRQTMGSGEYIIWTNNSNNLGTTNLTYWFNPDDLNVTRNYTLAGENTVWAPPYINITVPPTSITNPEIATIPRDRTSLYNRTNELTGIEEDRTRVLLPVAGLGAAGMGAYAPYCQNNYCPTDIVNTADVDSDGRITQEFIGGGPYAPFGTPGQPPDGYVYLDFQEGNIDGDKTSVNFEGPSGEQVQPDQKQGLLNPEVTFTRDDTNIIQDSISDTRSTDMLDQRDQLNHRVRTNNGIDIVPQDFTQKGTEIWTTPK